MSLRVSLVPVCLFTSFQKEIDVEKRRDVRNRKNLFVFAVMGMFDTKSSCFGPSCTNEFLMSFCKNLSHFTAFDPIAIGKSRGQDCERLAIDWLPDFLGKKTPANYPLRGIFGLRNSCGGSSSVVLFCLREEGRGSHAR